MNKSLLIVSAVSAVLSLSLVSCSSKEESSETTAFNETAVSETVLSAGEEKPAVSEYYEDYFSGMDASSQNQITILAEKLPELIGDYTHIYITDLDSNGRSELILSDPGFVIYEISEDQTSLVQTVSKSEDYPALYPVSDRIIFTDSEDRKHYIWKALKDMDNTTIRESEREYTYENGVLSETTLRSRLYDKFKGLYTSYSIGENVSDFSTYSHAVSDVLYRSNNRTLQLSIGVLTSEDIKNADSETLRQLLSELKIFFRFSDPSDKYNYADLEGSWNRTGGFSSGNDYFQNTENIILSVSGDMYRFSGAVQTEDSPLAFCLGSNLDNSLWHGELGENSFIKTGYVKLDDEGALHLEGTAVNQNGQSINIEWIFHKKGWNYSDTDNTVNEAENINPMINNTEADSVISEYRESDVFAGESTDTINEFQQ